MPPIGPKVLRRARHGRRNESTESLSVTSRLIVHRTPDDTATDIACILEDGSYATVRIADSADTETIAGQLRALAARMAAKRSDARASHPRGK